MEFALVAPIFILGIFLLIDFGRLLYAYSSISSASREGARILSLKSDQFTDCWAFTQMEKVGEGFPLLADPNSVSPNNDPHVPGPGNNPTTPPPGKGYIYIYPAVSTVSPPDQSPQCTNLNQPRAVSSTTRSVAVEIQYSFRPLTPVLSSLLPSLPIMTISVTQTEY